ncbi:MAG: hypothetical protein SGBAC_000058 [Bacillariaceae sp.]
MTGEQCDFVEHIKTPLNACSLETLPPVSWGDNDKRIWPLMLGCYELDESTGTRNGRLDFYPVPVPQNGETFQGIGSPRNVIGPPNPLSGVLDGKWYPRRLDDESLVYATAHASGEIIAHKVEGEKIALIGRTESRDSGLCLSLAWDSNDGNSATASRIISSYSDGKVGIHVINLSGGKIEFEETHFWDAHKMFRSPAEVWCAAFTSNPNVVLTGGDEGNLKIWDLRAGLISPIHTLQDFSAGVTVISPHPRVDHVVACGSYDETVCIYDLRSVADSKPSPLCHSDSVGGGLWRMKWHPYDNKRLLLGAMHCGCRIVQLDDLSSKSMHFEVTQEFTKHESMAYGADWIVDTRAQVEAAASCSFYDRAFYVWNVNGYKNQ